MIEHLSHRRSLECLRMSLFKLKAARRLFASYSKNYTPFDVVERANGGAGVTFAEE